MRACAVCTQLVHCAVCLGPLVNIEVSEVNINVDFNSNYCKNHSFQSAVSIFLNLTVKN